MADLTVIFRGHSDIEASIVRGLLETHGIRSLVSSDVTHAVFPLSIDGLGEVRIAVRAEEADEARRIIDMHRSEVKVGQVVRLRDEFAELEARLGYRFRDRGLVEHALTHRSRAHEDESGGVVDNESLEFLGDALVGFVIADVLFREFPELDEGEKSKIKASLVSTSSLARLAEQLDLGHHLLLGRGEERSGGRTKQALLADACEALLAALYLDGGLEVAAHVIAAQFRDRLDEVRRDGRAALLGDYKSALQEWLQSRDRPLPDYRVAAEHGPDHAKTFEVEVSADGAVWGRASGRTKKEAEQEAARQALERLKGRA
jgi:ribonuclease-3